MHVLTILIGLALLTISAVLNNWWIFGTFVAMVVVAEICNRPLGKKRTFKGQIALEGLPTDYRSKALLSLHDEVFPRMGWHGGVVGMAVDIDGVLHLEFPSRITCAEGQKLKVWIEDWEWYSKMGLVFTVRYCLPYEDDGVFYGYVVGHLNPESTRIDYTTNPVDLTRGIP